ncbi:MAG TPA: hypothetical protein VLZ32_06340 [Rhodanobacter sp.]|nr:hypothetical protein [Rhodanobacter sp.]
MAIGIIATTASKTPSGTGLASTAPTPKLRSRRARSFRRRPDRRCRSRPTFHSAEFDMSKGMDSKKTEKKKPAKTMKEKRAAKQEKKKSQ